jgi:hypothetical protein
MKKNMWFIFCFTLTTIASLELISDDKEMPVNQGFEHVLVNGRVPGWSPWQWAPGKIKADAICSIEKGVGRNSSQAAKIEVKKAKHVGVWCNTPALIDARPGGKYILSIWVRSAQEDITKCRMSVTFTDRQFKKNEKIFKQNFDLYPDNVWQKLSMPVQVPEKFNRVRIDISLLSPGTIYIDDVAFMPLHDIPRAPGKPYVVLGKTATPPKIDGDLSDECWQESIECSNFLLTQGKGLPKGATYARLCYDSNNLYFAFNCEEKFLDPVWNQMERFKAECKRKDSSVWNDDSVEIFIKNGKGEKYQLIINSLGTVFDKLLGTGNGLAWESGASATGTVQDGLWTLEIALPISSINIPAVDPQNITRMNLCRTRQPIHEFSSWSPEPKAFNDDAHWGYVGFAEKTPGVEFAPLRIKNARNIQFKAKIKDSINAPLKSQTFMALKVDDKYPWTFADEKKLNPGESVNINFDLIIPEKLLGIECRYADFDYSLVANEHFLYQSPDFRFKSGKASHLIFSRIGKRIPHSYEFKTLKEISIPSGQTEIVYLMLSSSKFDLLPEELYFIMDMPLCCSLISPLHNRNSLSPLKVEESFIERDDRTYRRYKMKFSKNAVLESDAPEWELLPIPLFIKMNGSSALANNSKIYFQSLIPGLKHSEKEQSFSIKALPPLSLKKASEKLYFMIWPWWPFLSVAQHGKKERERIFKIWKDAGLNTVSTELQFNNFDMRKTIRNLHGFNTMKMMPILTAGAFPGAVQYLKKHPEERETSFSGKEIDLVCFADLLEGNSKFNKIIDKVIGGMAIKYQYIHVDYEFGIFRNNSPGYSKKNIEMFRKKYGISEGESLSPELLAGKYREKWTEFRCWQNGEILKLYRQAIDKSNPNCAFGVYSAYQAKGLKRAHYGVDWNYFGKYLDLAVCGYRRGDCKATRKAIGPDKTFVGGEGIWDKDYDTAQSELYLFQRMADCGGGFMIFYDGVDDGRLYSAVSEVTGTVADFEEFFLRHRRADEMVEVANKTEVPPDSIAVLLNEKGERLLFLFNETEKIKKFILKNKNLPDNFKAVDYFEKSVFKNPREFTCDVLPQKTKIIYICSDSKKMPDTPKAIKPTPVNPPESQFPIFHWEDDGRTKTYSFECRKKGENKTLLVKKNIKENFIQSEIQLPPGEFDWRVAAFDILSGKQGEWSDWTSFESPSIINVDAAPETIIPGDSISFEGDLPQTGDWNIEILDSQGKHIDNINGKGKKIIATWKAELDRAPIKEGEYKAVFSAHGVKNTPVNFFIDNKKGRHNPSIENLGIWTPMLWGGYELPEDIEHICKDYDVTRSGSYSLKIIKTENSSPFWARNYRGYPDGSIPLKVKSGEKYRFSAWVKNSNKKVKSSIGISCLDENRITLKKKSACLVGKTEWTDISVAFEVPAGGKRISLGLSSRGGDGTSWFDCFRLEKLQESEYKKDQKDEKQ